MKFYVTASADGSDGRYASTLQFVDDKHVTYTIAVVRDVDTFKGTVSIVGTNGDQLVELSDVDEIARQLGRLLAACADQSLVVNTLGGTSLRGDEGTTADVFPPGRHPRINIKGA